jgi:hypothetical protein
VFATIRKNNRGDKMNKFEKYWTMARRQWLYRVAVSLLPIAVAWGFIAQDMASLIGVAIAALLSVGSHTASLRNMKPDA